MQQIDFQYGDYHITSNKALLQPEVVHQWLSTKSYWSPGIPFETVMTASEHSFCVGVLYNGRQIGYARLITDYAVFAYLADVYVEEEHRGKAISKKMLEAMVGLDWVKGIRRLLLATRDAHTLYAQYGFTALANPDRLMEIVRPNIYQSLNTSLSNDIPAK